MYVPLNLKQYKNNLIYNQKNICQEKNPLSEKIYHFY